MKIKQIIVFAGIWSMTACDVMDTKPFESYSDELVWGSQETAESFVLKSYDGTITYFAGGSASWESLTPNGAKCDQVSNSINTTATETGVDVYTDYGFGRFGMQRKCNMIIEKIAASTALSANQKKAMVAEGHFLRGALYFDMTRKMGRFVPITKVLDQGANEEFKKPLTSSVSESYEYVMADLDIAVRDLPEESPLGRANKYTALAFRCRAALQAYAYTKEEKYLDVVISDAQAIIGSGKYALSANYGGLFNEESPNDKEIIMARYFLDKDATIGGFEELISVAPNLPGDDVVNGSSNGVNTLNPNVKTFDGWGTFWPTQDLLDQYLAIDQETGDAKVWYETSQFKAHVESMPTAGIEKGSIETFTRHDNEKRYVPSAQDLITGRVDYPLLKHYFKLKPDSEKDITDVMFEYRDKRLDATVVRDKSSWQGELIQMNVGGNASQGIRTKEDGGWYTTTTGYYWRKGTVNADPRFYYSVKINYHYVIARLGEVYLNMAEAYLLKGNYAKAVEALNETRVKHGQLPASKAATLEDAWADYMRERRVEMAYENGDIYYSYLRWGKYGGYSNYGRDASGIIKDLDAPVYKIAITSDRKKVCVSQLTLLNSWDRKFTVKRYLFPIPQGQIDKRAASGIKDDQNSNW